MFGLFSFGPDISTKYCHFLPSLPLHRTEGRWAFVWTFPRNTTHGKRWSWDRGICWTLPLSLPPLSGILPRKSRRAGAGAGAGRAAALGGTVPWWELFPLSLLWFPPLTAMLPGQLAPGQCAVGALTSIFPPRKLDFLRNFSYRFLNLSDCSFSHLFFLPLSHSQHSASSTCKQNTPSHSKTSIYSQALLSPLIKVQVTVVIRLHSGKCSLQDLCFWH